MVNNRLYAQSKKLGGNETEPCATPNINYGYFTDLFIAIEMNKVYFICNFPPLLFDV